MISSIRPTSVGSKHPFVSVPDMAPPPSLALWSSILDRQVLAYFQINFIVVYCDQKLLSAASYAYPSVVVIVFIVFSQFFLSGMNDVGWRCSPHYPNVCVSKATDTSLSLFPPPPPLFFAGQSVVVTISNPRPSSWVRAVTYVNFLCALPSFCAWPKIYLRLAFGAQATQINRTLDRRATRISVNLGSVFV